MKNISIFYKISFEAITLTQKANLNENLLEKAHLNEKSRKL